MQGEVQRTRSECSSPLCHCPGKITSLAFEYQNIAVWVARNMNDRCVQDVDKMDSRCPEDARGIPVVHLVKLLYDSTLQFPSSLFEDLNRNLECRYGAVMRGCRVL